MDEKDLHRTARLLVKQFGDLAGVEATKRSRSFLSVGDREGAAVWGRVGFIVAEMKAPAPPKDKMN